MNSPVRKAVMEAALLTQQKLPGQPSLSFPAVETPGSRTRWRSNQVVARTSYTVDEALGASPPRPSSATRRPRAAGRPITT